MQESVSSASDNIYRTSGIVASNELGAEYFASCAITGTKPAPERAKASTLILVGSLPHRGEYESRTEKLKLTWRWQWLRL